MAEVKEDLRRIHLHREQDVALLSDEVLELICEFKVSTHQNCPVLLSLGYVHQWVHGSLDFVQEVHLLRGRISLEALAARLRVRETNPVESAWWSVRVGVGHVLLHPLR